jgi:putative transposase
MMLAHTIALDPNEKQETYFRKAVGTARVADHWALAEWQRQYAAWQADDTLSKPSDAALRRPLNALKREQFPGMLEVTKNAPQWPCTEAQPFRMSLRGSRSIPHSKRRAGMTALR